MAKFKVVLTGECLPDKSKNEVAELLAKVMKTDLASTLELLNGHQTLIKSNVDEATANKYLQALSQTGAFARVIEDDLEFSVKNK